MASPLRNAHGLPRLLLLISTLVAGLLLAGCGQTENDTKSATAGLPDLEQSLMAHQWLLDADDSSVTRTSTNPVTLVFVSGTESSGVAPCNTYRAAVTLDGDHGVRFGDVSSTLARCPESEMEAENQYLGALVVVRTADVTDRDRLLLTAGGVRLSFTAYDISAGIIGEWSIVDVRTAQAIESVLPGTTPTITFEDDHSLVVRTGCNTLHTTWTIGGDQLTVEPPSQTLMGCTEPAGVVDQEAALSAALVDATTIELTPTALTLLDDTGSIVLVATRP